MGGALAVFVKRGCLLFKLKDKQITLCYKAGWVGRGGGL